MEKMCFGTSGGVFLWIDLIFLHASLLSAVFISCERFYAVYWPLKHLTLSTRAYAIVIAFIWTLAFLSSAFFTLVRDFLPTKIGVYIMTILISIFLLGLCWCNVGTFFGGSFKRKNAPSDAIHKQNRGCQISTPDKHFAFCVFCCCVLVAS